MNIITKTQTAVLTVLANAIIFAQNSGTPDLKVDVNTHGASPVAGGDWMSNPLVWVIGALVLILLVALVARGGGNRN